MAKGSQDYNRLISRLPEIYVGKAERLQSLIKILCLASKKCMKDQKMHIAPWRKLKYMQAKWHGVREAKMVLSPDILSVVERSNRLSRRMVSLLTFDMVESLKTPSGLLPWGSILFETLHPTVDFALVHIYPNQW
ncbi:hypothetical protein Hanom_Chr16g01455561 [Helianthus anomalus]